jgi:hypothetical protein
VTTPTWQRPTACDNSSGNCVEVSQADVVKVRDGKLGDASPIIEFTPAEWADVLDDFRSECWGGREWFHFHSLTFTADEKAAFVQAVKAGEYG